MIKYKGIKMLKIMMSIVLLGSFLYGYSGYYAPFEGSKYITQGWNGGYSHGTTNGENTGIAFGSQIPFALDIAGDNFNVLATKSGIVKKIGYDACYGNYINIQHPDGLYTTYTHLKSTLVNENQNISRGFKIAKSGNTGTCTTGSHLHFQVNKIAGLKGISQSNSVKVNFPSFSISEVDNVNLSTMVFKTSQNSLQGISSKYIWHKAGTVYTDTQTDAQFGLQNNSNEAIVFNKVGLSLHSIDNKLISDVKIKSNQVINANSRYDSGILYYTAPSTAGNYLLVSKYQDESLNWHEIGYDEIVITQNPSPTSLKPVITGVGSIINPSENCFGCDTDEAIMQDNTYSPTAVVFQWNYRDSVNSCQYLNIVAREVDASGSVTNYNKSLNVSVYTKAWNSNTNDSAYNMTLPITIEKVDNWNTILISSKEALADELNIKATCSSSKTYSSNTAVSINQTKVESLGGYVWAGNSSIIRKDNLNSIQPDGVYRDVAISSKSDKGLTYFQWQPADNCQRLKLRAVESNPNTLYPSGDGESVDINAVNMKFWASKWIGGSNEPNYCASLPCTLDAPNGSNGYYIIKVKTNANTIATNYISATCE